MIRLLYFGVTLLILSGCVSPKKAVDVLSRPKNEPQLALLCATKFPVSDSLIKGDTVVNYDTLWGLEYRVDTLISEPQVITETKTVTVPKLVTKYVTVRDTIIRENTAKVSVLNSQIAKLYEYNRQQTELAAKYLQERDEYKTQRNKARLINWILFVVIGLSIGYGIKRKLKLF